MDPEIPTPHRVHPHAFKLALKNLRRDSTASSTACSKTDQSKSQLSSRGTTITSSKAVTESVFVHNPMRPIAKRSSR